MCFRWRLRLSQCSRLLSLDVKWQRGAASQCPDRPSRRMNSGRVSKLEHREKVKRLPE